MNPLNRQWFYRDFHKKLTASIGKDTADRLWKEAGKEYSRILASQPELKRQFCASAIWTRSIRRSFGISATTVILRFRKEPEPVSIGCGSTLRKIEVIKEVCLQR